MRPIYIILEACKNFFLLLHIMYVTLYHYYSYDLIQNIAF